MLDRDPRKWSISLIRLVAREHGVQHRCSAGNLKLWHAAVPGQTAVLLTDYASERSVLLAALREVARVRPLLPELEEEARHAGR